MSQTQIGGDHHFGHSSTLNTKIPAQSSSKPQEKVSSYVGHEILTFDERAKLVEHLLAIPSIVDRSRRATVISQLRPEIKTNVAYSSADKTYLFNIVETCLQHPNGMQELRDILQFFEHDSLPMQQFNEALNRLLPRGLGFGRNDDQGRKEQGMKVSREPDETPNLEGQLFLAPVRPAYPLVGRRVLLRRLKGQLLSGNNLALNGLPGVGKTALAIELANDPQIRAHFKDGILWAGLGRERDVLPFLGRWGTALNVSQMAHFPDLQSRSQALHAAIGTRRMLLVVDDAWQVDDALAFKVGGPNCAHLVTTRLLEVALRFAGNATTAVDELSQTDGYKLLEQLAPAAVAAEPEAARALVQAVGSLPLALILMGNYLRIESHTRHPRRIQRALERLQQSEQRLQLAQSQAPLNHPPHLPPGVPISLLASIGISDEILDTQARRALYALAVFPPKPNTFSEEAALAVCATPVDTLDTLTDVGLLESSGGSRYTLHQTIADYAKLKLSEMANDQQAAYERMATYFVEYVTAHETDYAAYPTLDLEMGNVLAALQSALKFDMPTALVKGVDAFYHFLDVRGLYAQAVELVKQAEAAARSLDDLSSLLQMLHYKGELAYRHGNYYKAERLYHESLVLARQLEKQHTISGLLAWLGVLAGDRGDYTQAQSHFQESLKLAYQIESEERILFLYGNLGKNAENLGDYARAENHLQQALALARKQGDKERMSVLLTNLGEVAYNWGDYSLALSYFHKALALARSIGFNEKIADILMNQGLVLYKCGETQQAEECLQESLALVRQIGHPERLCAILQSVGTFTAHHGDYTQAQAELEEGLALARQIGHRKNTIALLVSLAIVLAKQNYPIQAQTHFSEALTLARSIGHRWLLSHTLNQWAAFLLSQKQVESAQSAFSEGLEIAVALGAKELQARALFGQAQIAALKGDLRGARRHGKESLTIFETIGHRQASEVRDWVGALSHPL